MISAVDPAHSSVTSFPNTMVTTDPYTVAVHVADANGSSILGLNKTAFTLQNPGDFLSASSVTDQGNGSYVVTFGPSTVGQVLGTGNQTMSLDVNGVQVGTSATVNVVPSSTTA